MSDGLVDQAKVILLAYNIISGIVDIWLILVFFGLKTNRPLLAII
jgi:hypothetical protein